jgi:hypothetical protein
MPEVNVRLSGWDDVRMCVDQLIADSPEPFDEDTVADVRDLLALCVQGAPLPKAVAKGYWSTVSISWENFEIEVFADRLELYRFYDQRSEIWYEEHQPGAAFTTKFLDEIAALAL